MPKPTSTIKLGHSAITRIYITVFFLVWAVILFVFTATLAADKTPLVIVPTALLILLVTFGYKSLRVGVRGDDDALYVRNYIANVKLPRRQIRTFTVDPAEGEPGIVSSMTAVMRSGDAHRLDVFMLPRLTGGSRVNLTRSQAALEEWRRP